MNLDEMTGANRIAWNEAAPYHKKYTFDNLLKNFQQPDFNCLGPLKNQLLQRLDIKGKDIAQVACNNGRELISMKRLGARRCVGFDISEEFINQGRLLAGAADVNCEFVVADAYDLPESYQGQFDAILISSGTLRWMPDLLKFFSALSGLLRVGGDILLLEMHPILNVLSTEMLGTGKLVFKNSYFQNGPFKEHQGLDYYGKTKYDASPAYWVHHKLSDILNACKANGLVFQNLQELPYDLSGGSFKSLEGPNTIFPLSFALFANRVA